MEVRVFDEPSDFKYWMDCLNYQPEIINVVVFKDTLIVTFKRRA